MRKCKNILVISLIFSIFASSYVSCAEIDLSKIPVAVLKREFLILYKSQWEIFGMNDKLSKAIDDAMTEQTENLMWGTVNAQLALNNDKIIEKIQQTSDFKFAGDYDKFMADLEAVWGEKLREDITAFYIRQNQELYFELSNNPMAQASLRQDYDRVTSDKGIGIMNKISAEFSSRYSISETGAKAIGGIAMLAAKKYLQKKIMATIGRKLATSAFGKIAGFAVPFIGWAMLAWSAWDIVSMFSGTEETVKENLYNAYSKMYSEEVPIIYWDGMESYVRDAFIFAYEQLIMSLNRGLEADNSPKVKELSAGLSRVKKRFFADRVALIQEIIDGKNYGLDDVLEIYGEFIRDSSNKDFDSFSVELSEIEVLSVDISGDIKP